MTEVTTQQAKQMRSGIDILGEITSKGEVRTVNLRSGGTIDTCNSTLRDADGDIELSLWGEDIAKVKIGSKVKITNGYTNSFKGQISLTKGKFGQLDVE